MVALLGGCAGTQDAAWRDASAHNSDHFDLTGWKLTLPASRSFFGGEAEEIKDLAGYESRYFYDAPDGAMVFRAPVSAPTTKGSKYPRSELRERSDGKDAAWTVAEGGTLTASLRVDQVPTLSSRTPGKIVIGQIHGKDDELIRLYWDNGAVYFKNDLSGPDDKEHPFLLRNAGGQTPVIPLGAVFSYKIAVHDSTLEVHVYFGGNDYLSTTPINAIWMTNALYFKAGAYLGENARQGASGFGQVSFYGLDYSHVPGGGLGGLNRPNRTAAAK